jgi:type I site-specific restriction endonuclease
MDKQSLSERDICTKFVTQALGKDGWAWAVVTRA